MIEAWPPTKNTPAPFIDKRWQERLTTLGGTIFDGRPKLRLVWGQSPDASVFYCGQRRLKYLHHWTQELIGWDARFYDSAGRLKEVRRFPPSLQPPAAPGAILVQPVYEIYDVGIPRWFIEQYIPPGLATDGWEDARYGSDPLTGEIVDELGPNPHDGLYDEAFLVIADHEKCCALDRVFNSKCPGTYTDPRDCDLEYVEWLLKQLDEEPYRYTWEQMPPAEVVRQAIKTRTGDILERKLEDKIEDAYIMRNALMTHRRRLTSGGHGLDKFTYHDIGAALQRAKKV